MKEDDKDVDEATTSQAVACLIEVSKRLRERRFDFNELHDENPDEPTVH